MKQITTFTIISLSLPDSVTLLLLLLLILCRGRAASSAALSHTGVPLHFTIRSCGALRLPCTSANRNVRRVSRMFRADENRMTWH